MISMGNIMSQTLRCDRPMRFEDDSYAIDSNGNRVLIGLNDEETRELEHLDAFVLTIRAFAPVDPSQVTKEDRWLVLYTKHEEARELMEAAKTKH